MIKSSRKTQPVYLFVDLLLMTTSFFIPYVLNKLRHHHSIKEILAGKCFPHFAEYCFVFALWGIFIIITFKKKRLYGTDRSLSIPKEWRRVLTHIFYTSIIVGAIIFFSKYLFFSRFVFLLNFALLCVLLGGWRTIKRLILRKLIREGFHNTNILIIGAGKVGKVVLGEIRKQPYLGFNVVGFLDEHKEGFIDNIPVLGQLSDFIAITQKHFIDEIIVTIPSNEKAGAELMSWAEKLRLGVSMVPEYLEQPLRILDVNYVGIVPLLTYKKSESHPSEVIFKNLFDRVASLILIVLLFPLFVVIVILIKTDSSGPVFFIQKRVGLKAKTFNFYKFRSMVKNADKLKTQIEMENEVKGGVIFKIKKDPRITKVGKILRKYSLDELPQLFNVLRGNMSLVGPRPPLRNEVDKYDNPHMDRLSVKPGITGLSQIRGRSDLSFAQWIKWDLWYINNWSFGLDVRILLWTIPAVIKGKGAY